MKKPISHFIAVAVSGLALAACTSGTSTSPSTSMPMSGQNASSLVASSDCGPYLKANPDAKVTMTKDYVMVAGVGPSEPMYTKAQVTARNPTSGELMVSGMMHDMESMDMATGTAISHVEVHICSKATGRAVTGAGPSMMLSQEGTSSMVTEIMVAEMTGLDGNVADTHYGNNVSMAIGSSYSLRVTLDGQTIRWALRRP